MSVSPKILATALVVGGVGIGVPVYLVVNKNTFTTPQRLVKFIEQVTSSGASEFSQKVKCGDFDASATALVSGKFLEERNKEASLYSWISCSNTTDQDQEENNSLIGKIWTALIPNEVLNTKFSRTSGSQLEMNVQTTIGEKNSRNFVTSVFSNSTNQSSIKVRWVDLLDTNHFESKKVIVTLMERENQKPEEIYLLIEDSLTQQKIQQTH